MTDDLQLLVSGLLKLAVLVGIMALVIAAPSGASAASAGRGREGAQVISPAGSSFVWDCDEDPVHHGVGLGGLFRTRCNWDRVRSADTSPLDDWDQRCNGPVLHGTDFLGRTMNIGHVGRRHGLGRRASELPRHGRRAWSCARRPGSAGRTHFGSVYRSVPTL